MFVNNRQQRGHGRGMVLTRTSTLCTCIFDKGHQTRSQQSTYIYDIKLWGTVKKYIYDIKLWVINSIDKMINTCICNYINNIAYRQLYKQHCLYRQLYKQHCLQEIIYMQLNKQHCFYDY